jgi:hypothetical protein
MHKLIHKLRKA